MADKFAMSGLVQGLAAGIQQGQAQRLQREQFEARNAALKEQQKKLKLYNDALENLARDNPEMHQQALQALLGVPQAKPMSEMEQQKFSLLQQLLGSGQSPVAEPTRQPLAPVPESDPESFTLTEQTPEKVPFGQFVAQQQGDPLTQALGSASGRAALDLAGLDPNALEPKTYDMEEVDPETGIKYKYRANAQGQPVSPRRPVSIPGLDAFSGGEYDRWLARSAKRMGKKVMDLTKDEELKLAEEFATAKMSPAQKWQREEAKQILDGVMAGNIPVDPSFFGRKHVGTIMALAADQGVPINDLALEWNAAKRWIQTVNDPRNTTLRASINLTDRQLDDLSKMIQKTDFGPLRQMNRLEFNAALEGTLGQEKQQQAAQVEQVITDIISGLARVYSGGFAPTQDAFELAAANLDKYWSRTTLENAIKIQKVTLQYRKDAIAAETPITGYKKKPTLELNSGAPADPWGLY